MAIKVVLEESEENLPEAVVDDDITAFGEWFKGLGNDPIIPAEKSIIKTYLAWKLGLAKVG